jgi:hypothetical protein
MYLAARSGANGYPARGATMTKSLQRSCSLAVVSGLLLWALRGGESKPPPEKASPPASPAGQLIAVAPPPFSEGVYPCSECHKPEDEVNPKPHPVDFHDKVVFQHDSANRWRLDCHDTKNRNKLHLADGRLIGFEESYRLCGQCHGTHLRDWKAGDHGKRTGSWSGTKQYLLCAHCHDPHSPRIKPIAPMPPPLRQEDLR